MKYYIIAGEASGDLHASNVIKAIKEIDNQAEIRAWGGDLMQHAGALLAKHYKDLAFMGIIEVAKHFNTIRKNISFCKEDITSFQPDVILFVDYPGFNLRIAKWAHLHGFKTAYYISPTVWAWKEGRVHQINKYVDEMMVILPFEKPFYDKFNYRVHYVGHPLVEVIQQELERTNRLKEEEKIIALLPGSRTQEIKKLLPLMLAVAETFPEYQIVIAQAPGQDAGLYLPYLKGNSAIKLVKGRTYDLLKSASVAIVASGTATLETALLGVPQVVVYKTNALTFQIAKRMVRTKYVALPNLILNKLSVVELLQHDFTFEKLKAALEDITLNKDNIDRMQADYTKIWELLAHDYSTSVQVAQIVCQLAGTRKPH
jgi:lipid-A-disaccharide synthase